MGDERPAFERHRNFADRCGLSAADTVESSFKRHGLSAKGKSTWNQVTVRWRVADRKCMHLWRAAVPVQP
jgi:hypothetical protein